MKKKGIISKLIDKVKNEFENRVDGKNAHEKIYLNKVKPNKKK